LEAHFPWLLLNGQTRDCPRIHCVVGPNLKTVRRTGKTVFIADELDVLAPRHQRIASGSSPEIETG
jgi:hypothetical protein